MTPPEGGARDDPLRRLALFGRLLRDAGLRTGADRLTDAGAALGVVDVARLGDVRDALRCVYVTRHEEVAVFDAAFDLFWSRPDPQGVAGMIPGRPRPLPLDPAKAAEWRALLHIPESLLGRERAGDPAPATSSGYSDSELLRHKDFAEMTWDELVQMRRLLAQSPWRIAERRTRRRRPARRGGIDLRRTLRAAARNGGELADPARSGRRLKRRPVVVLCDVSGSMDRYSRQFLVLAHAVARRGGVETFAFSTRLTRVTHLLRRRNVDAALTLVARDVHDIGGGTRIGSAIHDFNRRHARRVLGHGAVVIVVSDGWDRGDVDLLDREMARLRRSCHRLVWLNPLMGRDSYTPEARGMAAALPHCDDFLPAHDVAALDELGRLLASLPARRGRR